MAFVAMGHDAKAGVIDEAHRTELAVQKFRLLDRGVEPYPGGLQHGAPLTYGCMYSLCWQAPCRKPSSAIALPACIPARLGEGLRGFLLKDFEMLAVETINPWEVG